MAKCKRCGKPARFMSDLCNSCLDLQEQRLKVGASADSEPPDPSFEPAQPVASEGEERGSTSACISLGLLFLLVGAYYLLIGPAEDNAEILGRSIVNVHRLYIGQTSAIMGAVFLAVGIRPR